MEKIFNKLVRDNIPNIIENNNEVAELKNKNLDDVIEIAKEKRLKRGGFKQRIFLEKTIDR